MFIKEKDNLERVFRLKSGEIQKNDENGDLYPALLAQEVSKEK